MYLVRRIGVAGRLAALVLLFVLGLFAMKQIAVVLFEDAAIQTKETELTHLTDVAMSVLRGYHALETAGEMTREAAQAEAARVIAVLDSIDDQPTLLTPTMGGSLPIYLFEAAIDAPIILLPVANHDNNQHGRDENLRLQNLWDAIEVYAAVLAGYGRPDSP